MFHALLGIFSWFCEFMAYLRAHLHRRAWYRQGCYVKMVKSVSTYSFCPTSNSKESPPTLASKVDQLEGLLKMLQEDLRKVHF